MAGRLRPLEGLRALGIVSLDESFQLGLQFRNAGEYATVCGWRSKPAHKWRTAI